MITSHHNPLLKDIRRLARRPAREASGRFVAEGEDLVAAADAAGWTPVARLRAGVDVEADALAKVSALGSGTRVLALYEQRWAPAPAGPLCVALWGVGDPGNVGTILRSALAFGAAGVAVGPGCADPYGPKAVRASMGAIFSMPVARVDDVGALPVPTIALVARAGEPLAGTGGQPPAGGAGASPDGAPAGTLVVGAERDGLPADVVAACDRVAHIPIATESLNAAMAATVALYELTRAANRVPRG